jgi:hypothetical protein
MNQCSEMQWNDMKWFDMTWKNLFDDMNEIKRIKIDWNEWMNALNWIEEWDGMELNDLNWTELNWT